MRKLDLNTNYKNMSKKTTLKKTFLTLILLNFFLFQSCKKDESTTVYEQRILLGALVPLTGGGASAGESGNEGILLGMNDVRDYLQQNNPSWSVDIVVEDTETDTLVAREKYNILKARGIKMIIGPFSSAVLKSLKPHADRDGILLISPASVATNLSEENDNVFRLLPDVTSQGEAMTALLVDEGIELIIPLVRDDIWGEELLAATSAQFGAVGFETAPAVYFDPNNLDANEIITQLSQQLSDALMQTEASKTGIYMLSYGEGYTLLKTAKDIPQFADVKWFGSSGFAENNTIVSDIETADFAVETQLLCPSFGLDPEAYQIWNPIQAQLEAKMNRKPEIYAFTSYDAVWLATKTYLQTQHNANTQILKQGFMLQAEQYFGASGWTSLNNAGDRNSATYDFWGVTTDENLAYWENKVIYNNITKTLSRIN